MGWSRLGVSLYVAIALHALVLLFLALQPPSQWPQGTRMGLRDVVAPLDVAEQRFLQTRQAPPAVAEKVRAQRSPSAPAERPDDKQVRPVKSPTPTPTPTPRPAPAAPPVPAAAPTAESLPQSAPAVAAIPQPQVEAFAPPSAIMEIPDSPSLAVVDEKATLPPSEPWPTTADATADIPTVEPDTAAVSAASGVVAGEAPSSPAPTPLLHVSEIPAPTPVPEKAVAPVPVASAPSAMASLDDGAAGRANNSHDAERGGSSRELEHYLARLRTHLADFRQTLALDGIDAVAVAALTIGVSGEVLELRLARSSGLSALDREALDLLRRAAPLPLPPGGAPLRMAIPISVSQHGR